MSFILCLETAFTTGKQVGRDGAFLPAQHSPCRGRGESDLQVETSHSTSATLRQERATLPALSVKYALSLECICASATFLVWEETAGRSKRVTVGSCCDDKPWPWATLRGKGWFDSQLPTTVLPEGRPGSYPTRAGTWRQ